MTQPPDYSLFFTDGDQNHLPNEKELRQGYKSTDDYDLTKKALSIFAVEMAKRLETNIDKGESELLSCCLPSQKTRIVSIPVSR